MWLDFGLALFGYVISENLVLVDLMRVFSRSPVGYIGRSRQMDYQSTKGTIYCREQPEFLSNLNQLPGSFHCTKMVLFSR